VKGYGQEEFDLKKWSHLHYYSRQKYEKMEGLETLTDQERIPYQYYEVKILWWKWMWIIKANRTNY